MSQLAKCSQCQTLLDIDKVKYWNDDSGVHVFCDAYCSHDWHMERDRKKKVKDVRSTKSRD